MKNEEDEVYMPKIKPQAINSMRNTHNQIYRRLNADDKEMPVTPVFVPRDSILGLGVKLTPEHGDIKSLIESHIACKDVATREPIDLYVVEDNTVYLTK